MPIRLQSLGSISSVILLLALCPVLAICAATPPVLTNAKSTTNAPPIDSSGLGGGGDLTRHPFLAPVTPLLGARTRDASLPGPQDRESTGDVSELDRESDPSLRPSEESNRSNRWPSHTVHTGSERDRGFRVKVVDGYGQDSERTSIAQIINDDMLSNDEKSSTGATNNSATTDGGVTHSVIRGIMENFADDFESPPDSQLADDVFNREPYYYDVYYDTFENDNADVVPKSTFTGDDNLLHSGDDDSYPAVTAGAEPADSFAESVDLGTTEEDLANVHEDLDLRLLGADLQSELGFVLQQLTNGSQRNRRHQAPVRHHDPQQSHGINVGMQMGSCPPPVHSLPPGLCGAAPCTSHMMCYPQKMCCFNGCTYTCTEPVRPPPVFDWLEDTGSRRPLLDPLNPALPLRFESSPLSYGTGGGETVRLPGGCTLSARKYDELKEFMTAESIQDCLCSGGEVVCVVKSAPPE